MAECMDHSCLLASLVFLTLVCALWAPSQNSMRYAYSSEEGDEEFDMDDTPTLIKPSPLALKNVSSPELRFTQSGNDLSHGNLEEEKTAQTKTLVCVIRVIDAGLAMAG